MMIRLQGWKLTRMSKTKSLRKTRSKKSKFNNKAGIQNLQFWNPTTNPKYLSKLFKEGRVLIKILIIISIIQERFIKKNLKINQFKYIRRKMIKFKIKKRMNKAVKMNYQKNHRIWIKLLLIMMILILKMKLWIINQTLAEKSLVLKIKNKLKKYLKKNQNRLNRSIMTLIVFHSRNRKFKMKMIQMKMDL